MLKKGLSCVSSKVSRTVLRGGRCGNTLFLPDYLSAAIADLFLRNYGEGEIKYVVGDYDGTHPDWLLDWADTIFLLDYSLPNHMMDKYFDKLTWIDHHETAITRAEIVEMQKGKKFWGVREIGKSGCLLTWDWFIDSDYGANLPWTAVPLVVTLVNDRDIWAWKLGEDTAAFHEASRMFMNDLSMWQSLLKTDQATQEYIKHGHMLLGYIRDVVDTYNQEFGWEGTFEGHPVVFLNGSGVISGELHKRLRDTHPRAKFAVVFVWKGVDKVYVGLYRTDGVEDIHLGEIATKYGGGGRAGAAGFHINPTKWHRIMIGESITEETII